LMVTAFPIWAVPFGAFATGFFLLDLSWRSGGLWTSVYQLNQAWSVCAGIPAPYSDPKSQYTYTAPAVFLVADSCS
jgi:hypothetical protein